MSRSDFGPSEAAVRRAVKEWKEITGLEWNLDAFSPHQKLKLRVACTEARLKNPPGERIATAAVGWLGAMVAVLIAWAIGLMPMIGSSLTSDEASSFMWEFVILLIIITALVFSFLGRAIIRSASRRETAAALKVLESLAEAERRAQSRAEPSRELNNKAQRLFHCIRRLGTRGGSLQESASHDSPGEPAWSPIPSSTKVNSDG